MNCINLIDRIINLSNVSDYNSLEEAKRAAESAHSSSGNINGFRGYIGFKLPRNILLLRNAANKRGTKLLLLPPAMSKRKMNQSRYDRKRNSIFWTIEWKFHGTDVVTVDHNVDENLSLIYVIKKHLMPTRLSSQLTSYCSVKATDLKFFIRKTPKGLDSPFRELDIIAPISKQLSDVVILEYPVIFVCLPSHSFHFEVENDTKSAYKKQAIVTTSTLTPSPKAIILPKKEVEESVFCTDQSALLQFNTQVLLDYNTRISNEVGECSKPNSENSVNEEKPFGDVNFDFLHELSDVYSELLGGMNPDEFLRLNDSYDDLNTLENIFPGDELEKEKF